MRILKLTIILESSIKLYVAQHAHRRAFGESEAHPPTFFIHCMVQKPRTLWLMRDRKTATEYKLS